MPSPAEIVTAPSVEPLALDEVKTHLRIDSDLTEDDALVSMLITAAREDAETITRRCFISQQLRLVGDRFPSPMAGKLNEFWIGQQWAAAGLGGVSRFLPTDRTGYGVVLPWSKVISVDSITYVDTAGVTQTLSAANYLVDAAVEPARIMPAYGVVWPQTRQQVNAVTILYTVGYGTTAADVPSGIKAWMLLRIGSLYANRAEVAILPRGKVQELPYVDNLLSGYRVLTA